MKKDLLKRIDEAEVKVEMETPAAIRRLVSKMTTDELKEIAYGEPADERIQEIMERARKR